MARKRVTRGSFLPLASIYLTEGDVDAAGVFNNGVGVQGQATFALLNPAIGPFRLRFYMSVNGSAWSMVLSAQPASSNDVLGVNCGPVQLAGQHITTYTEFCTASGELLLRTAIQTYDV